MKRILVIGSPGAGKSTFSRRLGEATGVEVIHLDRLSWKSGWIEAPRDEFRQKLADALKKDSWIIDGNYGSSMPERMEACDTVIYLDFPRTLCVYRVLKRVVTYRKGSRPDMADGCDERFDWEFLKWVWTYPTRSKPKVEKLLEKFQNEKTIIRLNSTTKIEEFFGKLSVKDCQMRDKI